MRAWQVQGHGAPREVLHLVDVDEPEPGPGEVRLRVLAAGLGLPDVLMCRGVYPLTPPLPFTPGQEVVGEVTAVGDGVTLAVGERVMAVTSFPGGHGGFAESALAYARSAFPVPAGLDDAEAAGFWIPNMTAWLGLVDRGRLEAGEWLAVLGAAGGSGSAAVQLGRALGARVVAVVGHEDKASFCRSLGAEATVDHRNGPLAEALRTATGGHGADVVYDPVGGEPAEASVGAMAPGGRLLAVGFASGSWPVIDVHRLVRGNVSLVGVYAGGQSREHLEDVHARLAELVASGHVGRQVTTRTPFEQLPDALEALARRAAVGKSVLLLG